MSFGGAASAAAPIHAQLAIASGLAKVLVYYFGVDWGTRVSGPYGFHDLYAAKSAFEKPRFGSRRWSGIWPPSNPRMRE